MNCQMDLHNGGKQFNTQVVKMNEKSVALFIVLLFLVIIVVLKTCMGYVVLPSKQDTGRREITN